jgi:hypothetical protein
MVVDWNYWGVPITEYKARTLGGIEFQVLVYSGLAAYGLN